MNIDRDKYITTQNLHKLTIESFSARLKQVNLMILLIL